MDKTLEPGFDTLNYEEREARINQQVKYLQEQIEQHVMKGRSEGRDGVRVLLKCIGHLTHMLDRLSCFQIKDPSVIANKTNLPEKQDG